jgi:hypothetical protein
MCNRIRAFSEKAGVAAIGVTLLIVTAVLSRGHQSPHPAPFAGEGDWSPDWRT